MNTSAPQRLVAPVSPKETIQQTYLEVSVSEGVFPAGAFALALPKGWGYETAGTGRFPDVDSPLLRLARFMPGAPNVLGASAQAEILIWCAFLPREMHGSDWLRIWLSGQTFSIADFAELSTTTGNMGDALALNTATGRLHRFLTIKDGDLLFLIDGSFSYRGSADDAEMQEITLMAMLRFRLLEPSLQTYAEPMEEHALSGTAGAVRFALPTSWLSVEPGDKPPEGALLQFNQLKGDEAAATFVAALGAPSPKVDAQLLENQLMQKLEAQGYHIGDAQPLSSYAQKGIEFATFLRRAEKDGVPLNLLCLRVRKGQLPFAISTLSPAAEADVETWAITRRAFDIARDTLHATQPRLAK